MFCSNCGQADQASDSYCRSCGEFIADPSNRLSLINRVFGISSPEQQLTISLIINAATALVSVFLIFFLMGFFDGQRAKTGAETPGIIYVVYVFLGLFAGWQFLSFALATQLKKKLSAARSSRTASTLHGRDVESLPSANLQDAVRPSVTEEPTQILKERRRE